MAKAARKANDDLNLLEEQVDSGLGDFLNEYRTDFALGGGKKDELAKRFVLHPNKPIPELSHDYAKAYAADDGFNPARQTYAMVLTNTVPCRQHTVPELTGFSNPHLSQLLGSGTVNCSHLGESRLVLFFERPAGKLLSEAMKETPRLHEHVVTDYVLGPGIRGLAALKEKKTAHGNIGPLSFFMGETPALRECISAPTGTLNHHVYLPLEILLTDPLARGEANEKTDVYALGILALELMYGIERQKSLDREDLLRQLLSRGSYATFSGGREFSDAFEDFLRGILNDDPEERWGLDQAIQWLAGKRFNMIAPAIAKDATRPFIFGGDNYVNPKVLAHALHRQWRLAAKDLKTSRLERWCETNVNRTGVAERVERALRIGGDGANEAQLNDMITRTIAALDPKGPIRSAQLAVRPDGIGAMFAHFMAEGLTTEQAQLVQFIETDIANNWSEHYAEERSGDLTQTIWKLQKCRPFLKQKALGFGMERVLYELNPTLSCQSPLVKQYHVTDIVDLLKTLDAIAVNLAPDTSFVDRHIAAFVACKIGMSKEMHLNEIAIMPALSKNEELIVLKILAKIQQKHNALRLPGLCAWIGMRIEKMLDVIHSRVVRKKIKQRLKKMAAGGRIEEMLVAIINRDIAIRDYDGFTRAIALHQLNANKIERYQNPRLVDYYARDTGGKIASTIGFTILVITSYWVIMDVLGIS